MPGSYIDSMETNTVAKQQFRAIFISDVHLGTKDCQAQALLKFFKHHEAEQLFLVGDIIDGWSLKRKIHWPQTHSDVIQKILRMARKGQPVYYVLGNHDEFIRKFIPLRLGDHFHVINEHVYQALNGDRIGVIHGDSFDSITMNKKWLALLGDVLYQLLLRLNRPLNKIRQWIGYKRHWSLAKYLKRKVKKSVQFIDDYEQVLADYAAQKQYQGIINGHIHHAEIRAIGDIQYMNCGDWVESCTALVETLDGQWQIIEYGELA